VVGPSTRARVARTTGTCLSALALALVAPVAIGAQGDASGCPDATLEPEQGNLARVEAAMVCLLNRERSRNGLEPMSVDRRLERSSAAHTRDMVEHGYFSHHANGRPGLYARLRRAHYFKGAYTAVYSENLGYGPPETASALGMHKAFMSSEGHSYNMLYRRFRAVGIGSLVIPPHPTFFPDHEAVVFTIDFGRRYVRHRRCVKPRADGSQDTSTPPRRSDSTPPRRYCR
jgi:uncharacterized protein YkwD